eukprot:TRINITY_DN17713_c0_g1_i3.p1 TRINITY_DN17713_c0_g1~~TRINITY_DN17713_c0_g1_i3.p1  ORF type:complete len:180 (-),score=28.78 TRINITY_DN17713_c0_g1_i3:119-658(-)
MKALRGTLRVVRKLQHPHIMPVQAVFFDGDTRSWYVEMPFASQGNLRQWLQAVAAGEVSAETRTQQAKAIIWQLLLALDYLWSCGVVHGDLEPENILLSRGDTVPLVQLADFETSVVSSEQSQTTVLVAASVWYLAPELMRGTVTRATPWSDAFALGIILHEILTGKRPQPSKTLIKLI